MKLFQYLFPRKKILIDYFIVILGTGFGRVLSFVTSIILARKLGPENFGLFSLFFTIMFLVWQLPIALDVTYVRYVKAEKDLNKISALMNAFIIKFGIFILLSILTYPISYFLAHSVFHKPDSVFFIAIGIISGLLLSLFSTVASVYQAEEEFVKFSLVSTVFYFAVIFAISTLIFMHFTVTLNIVVWIYISAALIGSIFTIVYLYTKTRDLFHVSFGSLSGMLHFSKWLLASNLTYIIIQRIDTLILARYLNYQELGVYSVSVRMAMLATLFSATISTVLMPKGSQALQSLQHLRLYLKESFILVVGLIFVVLVMILTSSLMIKIIFGLSYIGASVTMQILLLGTIFTLLYTPLMYLFYAENNTLVNFQAGMVMLASSIVALLVLVPKYGATGAAISVSFSSFCGLLFIFTKSFRLITKRYL